MTIIVGIILVSAGIVSVSSAISEATKASFAEELKLIEDETSVYYLQNNEYPTDAEAISQGNLLGKITKSEELKTELEQHGDLERADSLGGYYVINLDKLPLDKKTRGIKKGSDETDIYVVSVKTNKIYYLKGVKTGGKTYFSLANLIKYVGKVSTENEGEVEVTQVGSLTVKRLRKTWTNAMGITLTASLESGEALYTRVEGTEIQLKAGVENNTYKINSLDDVSDYALNDTEKAKVTDDLKEKFRDDKDKEITFYTKASEEEKDTLTIDLSNYDILAPTYDDPETWSITQTNEDNVITFKVDDDISGVKEIRYAYLEKYTGEGNDCDTQYYYKDVEVLDASFIKARGKKATISSDGQAVLKVPRDIAAIQIVVIDKAGNYPVDTEKGNGIFYVVKKDYVGCELKSISSTGLTFYGLFNSKATGGYIAEYNVSVSTDGKNYTDPITKTPSGTLQSLKDLVEDYQAGITITDKVYVKIVGIFKNETDASVVNEINRIFEFSLSDGKGSDDDYGKNDNTEEGVAKVNAPKLLYGMTPIKFDDNGTAIDTVREDSEWYA